MPLVLPGLLSLLSSEVEQKEKEKEEKQPSTSTSTSTHTLPWLQEAIRLYLNEATGGTA